MQVFPDELAALGADRTASTACLPVLMWSFECLGFERFQMVNQARIGEALGLGASTVGRALAHLEERGFLERRGAGPRQTWRITTKGGWMGTAASYQKAKRERGENPAGLRVVADHDVDGVVLE